MAASLDQARTNVHLSVEKALRFAESSSGSFYSFERELWWLVLAIGQALVVVFLLTRSSRFRCDAYRHRGETYVREREGLVSELGTLFGKVEWTRMVGRQVGARRSARDLPVDRELGLCGSFSLGVVERIAKLSTQSVFETGRQSFCEVHGWAPSSRTVLRMVDAIGGLARPFIEASEGPEGDGEILVIMADAGGTPTVSSKELKRRRQPRRKLADGRHERRRRRREHPRPRKSKGEKSKNAKMAVIGVIYTLKRTAYGLEGPINKRVIGTFDSHEALFLWLRREADKRGYGRKPTVFIADGCRHIWRMQEKYFDKADCCVDWYHIVEKIWQAGACLHREGSRELRDWVQEQKRLLRRGSVGKVIQNIDEASVSIAKTGPGTKTKRERLESIAEHLVKNKHRLQYAKFRKQDLDIGSGPVEGAVRNVVRLRLDGPGMRWGRGRSELVLHLRCILLNGQWQQFSEYLASQAQIKLPARAAPTQPHDAKPKKAA
jgi:hypothetical protein